ncbi:FAD-binding oxidoreductase [Glaciihabitans sp. dw_435]|uniref:NAD(P)/FAD-dependent oxidoreductase n=1 Tax=Glaciihabitans sp. dw_435 TaxID=2720081 RepID=UPI001BD5031A|nr:FAD-binding oxidoreductase [Glaciihabitans sp. dw_435]
MTIEPAYGHTLRHPRAELVASLAGASTVPFWLDRTSPDVLPRLAGDTRADLVVVGGGFCGLWTALMAKERDPNRDVVLVEGKRIAWAASGRNGGFVEASLTHGEDNGQRHFADELEAIEALAADNFAALRETLIRYGIDAEWEEQGALTVATEPHQVEDLRAAGENLLEGESLRTVTKSPVVRAAVLHHDGMALVHPVKLARGLLEVCVRLGVRVLEKTPVSRISDNGDGVSVVTRDGVIRSRQVALATNGFPSMLKRNALRTVPIYDYVLVTEPLSAAQLDDIGWVDRYGISDSSRQFHYYRKTADDRILWGGYDAVYHRGRKILPEYDQRPETFERLADHFFTTYPTLRGTKFSHAWGGMIDMSTKFVSFQGLARGGKVAYSAGYTGLGVGATRFGAAVMLDLLSGESTPRTRLRFPTTKPFPVPPEPVAFPAIQTMRAAVARSDANGGKDGPLIRGMELFGIGFDS